MHLTKRIPAASIALGLSVLTAAGVVVAPAAHASVAHTTMAPVTKSGRFVKVLSKSSFKISVGKKTYVVTVDAMTHVKLDNKAVKIASLKRGDTVTVKGPLEMDTIKATSVVAGMGH